MTSVWSPVCQDASHVGAAGIGLVCLKGAPVSTRSVATLEFKRFGYLGTAPQVISPTGSCRVAHIFVVYGFQGADKDPEQPSSH